MENAELEKVFYVGVVFLIMVTETKILNSPYFKNSSLITSVKCCFFCFIKRLIINSSIVTLEVLDCK